MIKKLIFPAARMDSKLTAVFVLIGVLPLAIVGFLAVSYANQILHQQVIGKLQVVADSKAQRIEGYLFSSMVDVTVHSQSPTILSQMELLDAVFHQKGIDSPEYAAAARNARIYLARFVQPDDYDNVLLVDARGNVVFSVLPINGLGENLRAAASKNSALARVFDNVDMLLATEISDYETDAVSGEQKAFIAAPIFKKGVLVGSLVLRITDRELLEIARDYTGLGETGETVIGYDKGDAIVFTVPTRHDPAAVFQRRIASNEFGKLPMQKAVRGNSGVGQVLDYRGVEVLAAWKYLPSLRCGLVVKMDMTEAFAPVRTVSRVSMALGILVTLLVVFLAPLVGRYLGAPIRELAQATQAFSTGDLTRRAHITSKDEIGNLAGAFNQMADTIQRQIATLSQARNDLERRVEERTADLAKSNRTLQKEIAERKKAEAELQWKTAFLEAQVNPSNDAWLVVDPTGKTILQNQRMVDLWKMPPHIANDTNDEAKLQYVAAMNKNPRQFLEKVEYLYTHPDETSQDELELVDGSILDRCSYPCIGKDGTRYGRIWMFRDITARKRTEAELETLHNELLEASRRSGMAEIATNVLHNVGNVLNSVNISTGLIMESVKRFRASNLARVVALLREHEHDLGRYITHDPNGKHVPAHLAQLSEHLLADQEAVVSELDSLRRNVEHIKEIVAIQQSFGTAGGVRDWIDVASLVEDSLRMSEGTRSHGVEVIREFEKVPPLNVEKHKILQILVNLMRNARYACDESGRADKRLTVRVAHGGGRITISVADNGVGIPSENLARIFDHGFTTRKGGHGFGLHSSARAAKEMDGFLTVQSGGPGQGACFTLNLPCPPREDTHD